MRKSIAKLVCGSALLVMFCGCGGPKKEQVVIQGTGTVAPSKSEAKESLKKTLEGIRRSGQLSSAMAGLRQTIEQLEDMDLSDDLLKQLPKLENAKTPDEIKAVSKSMMSKL